MEQSITYFTEKCIPRFEDLQEIFLKEPSKLNEFVRGLQESLNKLGNTIIRETLEMMDEQLRSSAKVHKNWRISTTATKQLITSFGAMEYRKTYFKKADEKYTVCLLDRVMKMPPDSRMTEDVIANILTEAVDTSYRRGGEAASDGTSVSKQTVKNILHNLEFPKYSYEGPRKVVDYLYIDADEDHTPLQFQESKGDLELNEYGRKNNCQITKLIYVYEGVEPEAPKSKRNRLIHPYYFCRVCEGKGNEDLWKEVWEYIECTYDTSKIKKIYLNSDGGAWIKAGTKVIDNAVAVLDGFHISEHLTAMTGHLYDSQDEAISQLRSCIRNKSKNEFDEVVEKVKLSVIAESKLKNIDEHANYIKNNWTAARARLVSQDSVLGCSAEGHVSHVLASRMSTLPMGWSKKGAGQMARLRAYKYNKGKMIDLVRHQSIEEVPLAAGAEEIILSAGIAKTATKTPAEMIEKYRKAMSCHVTDSVKKKAWFAQQIWGL